MKADGAKKLGLKKTSSGAAGVGIVKEIRLGGEYESGDESTGFVCIEHGKPKKAPKGKEPYPSHDTPKTRLTLPADVVRTLHIGQRVRVTVTPA